MDRREAIKRTSLLLGGVISSSAIAGVLSGCQANNAVDWTPVFLDNEQAKMVEAIADGILPATDTPGALDVGVPSFIDLMLKEAFSNAEQKKFTEGLAALDVACGEQYQKEFLACNKQEQTALLTQQEKASDGTGFIRMIKELTLLGYFTSETVMSNVLNYNPVPGKYEGCVDANAETVVGVDNNIF